MNLEVVNLTKRYRTQLALDGVSCAFSAGVHGLLGKNGAGKSTLMNLLTDSISRDAGAILLDGVDIRSLGGRYRSMFGYMPQNSGFFPEMTASTFLHYMAELKGIDKKTAKTEVGALLEVTNLREHRHKRVGALSGGMCQRLSLAQALLGNPPILLLDEPTAGLDPSERIRIRNFLSTIARDKIVMIATHIVSDIEMIADNLVLMHKGKIVSTGQPDALLAGMMGKVKEVRAERFDPQAHKCEIVNVFRQHGVPYYRLVGDDLPDEGDLVTERFSLEDLFIYSATT